jgi:hypothetical protein
MPTHAFKLSNNIIQKRLAFGREKEWYCRQFRVMGARRSRPAGLLAEMGLQWCGANEGISMSKSAKMRLAVSSAAPVPVAKPAQATPGSMKSPQVDAGSKQSRVIAMLHSPVGATIAAMMKARRARFHFCRK